MHDAHICMANADREAYFGWDTALPQICGGQRTHRLNSPDNDTHQAQ